MKGGDLQRRTLERARRGGIFDISSVHSSLKMRNNAKKKESLFFGELRKRRHCSVR
ncbi:hypothetical protein FH972_011307 [Carpinus fangiana]|uniref:Uncharacterized protein n=1 Tax=Carpinus fangiana TaxID=176857 RepID=A0A660KSR9_9ROSI|nr:hypothetical protein FH972_011307 [Carpinus fangiana]